MYKSIRLPGMLFILGFILSGCNISVNPSDTQVTLEPGQAKIFSVSGAPLLTKYQWLVDGVPAPNGSNSIFLYTLNRNDTSEHRVEVIATYMSGDYTFCWNINSLRIMDISPSATVPGSTVTLSVGGMLRTSKLQVVLGDIPISTQILSGSTGKVTFLVPANASSGPLYLSDGNRKSNSIYFNVSNISVVTPTSAEIVQDELGNDVAVNLVIVSMKPENDTVAEAQKVAAISGGTIVGHIPMINGYQIRLQTKTLSELRTAISNMKTSLSVDFIMMDQAVNTYAAEWDPTLSNYSGQRASNKVEEGASRYSEFVSPDDTTKIHPYKVAIGINEGAGAIATKIADFDQIETNKNGKNKINIDALDASYDETWHSSVVMGMIAADLGDGDKEGGKNSGLLAALKDASGNPAHGGFDIHIDGSHLNLMSSLITSVNRMIDEQKVTVINWSNGFVQQGAINTDGTRINRVNTSEIVDSARKCYNKIFENIKTSHPNVVIVAAAGNSDARINDNFIPQSIESDNLIVVGGHDYNNTSPIKRGTSPYKDESNDNYASNYGPRVDIAAAFNVQGSKGDGRPGTSFSAPLVVATVAAMQSINPDMSAKLIRQMLRQSATPIDNTVRKLDNTVVNGEVFTRPLTSHETSNIDDVGKGAALNVQGAIQLALSTVSPGVNRKPKADAGKDQYVNSGDTVILNGSESYDPDNNITSYYWEQIYGPKVTLSNPTSVNLTFVPVIGTSEHLVFKLTVTDSGGLTSTDTCVVGDKYYGNRPPIADAGPDQKVAAGSTVTLYGNNSKDLDYNIKSCQWVQTSGPTVTLVNSDSDFATFTAPDAGGSTLTFELTVTDAGGLQSKDSCVVSVVGYTVTCRIIDTSGATLVGGMGWAKLTGNNTDITTSILEGTSTFYNVMNGDYTLTLRVLGALPGLTEYYLPVTVNSGDVRLTFSPWPYTLCVGIDPHVVAFGGKQGGKIQQTGYAFTPGGTAQLHFRRPDGSLLDVTGSDCKPTVDSDGYYSREWTVPSDAMLGTYQYWAVDLASGKVSPEVSFTVNSDTTSPPSVPDGFSVSQITNGFRLSWNSVSGATQYAIYWGTDSSVSETNYAGILTTGSTVFDHTGLSNGYTYYYRIQACNSTSCSSLSSPTIYKTYTVVPSISVPSGFSMSQITNGFRLSWNSVSGATQYAIYWGTDSSVSETNYAGILTTGSTMFDHTGLSNGYTYYYRIQACNASVCSSLSSPAIYMRYYLSPSIPTGVSAAYQSSNHWNYIRWNASTGATSYIVYWGTSPGVTKSSNRLTPTSTTDYGHSGVVSGYTYYYRIAASNSYGESSLSTEVNAHVP